MNEMSEYYENLRSNPPEKPKKEGHKGNWSLVWSFGGQKVTVLPDKPYAMCKDMKRKKEREIQFSKGVWSIVPFKPTKP